MRRNLAFAFSAVASLISSGALAEDVPKSAQDQAKATSGATEVTSDKATALDRAADAKDATELSLSAGGLQAGGNANLLAMTAAEKFRLRREDNQFKQVFAANYARSAAPPSTDLQTTVANIQALVRYDRFLGDFTLFLGAQGRSDKFQGLNARANVDPGVGYYFINEKTNAFWTELGYDFQYDNRRDDAIFNPDGTRQLDGSGKPLDKNRVLHSGRAFIGYENAFNATSKVTAGVEFLQGLSDTKVYRVNSDVALTTKIAKSLAISFAFSERFDSEPLPGKQKMDTVTSASLVYTFLLSRPDDHARRVQEVHSAR